MRLGVRRIVVVRGSVPGEVSPGVGCDLRPAAVRLLALAADPKSAGSCKKIDGAAYELSTRSGLNHRLAIRTRDVLSRAARVIHFIDWGRALSPRAPLTAGRREGSAETVIQRSDLRKRANY